MTVRLLTAAGLTARCFLLVAGYVGVVWFVVVGPGGEYTWQRLPEPWDERAAIAFTGLAIAVGLAIYFVYLRRTLLAHEAVPRDLIGWYLAILGPLPIVLVVGGFFWMISRMRIGW